MINEIKVVWGGHPVKLIWQPSKVVLKEDIVTSVHGCCFHAGKVLLVRVKNRGFNMPGGHVEANETPEETLHREIYEEGYVKGKATYIGAIEVNHKKNPFYIVSGKYPLIGYQLFYRLDIEDCFPFLRENEATTRIWVEPEEVPYVIDDHELIITILREAEIINN